MFELIPFDRRNHSVSAFDPFRAFDDMERSFFRDVPSVASFRTDVTDTGDAYKLEAELPGFKKEDIKIDVENDCLTISAERKVDEDKKDEKNNFVKRERYYGSYSRSFNVSEIDVEGIKAAYENGVLTLTMPKKAPAKPESKHLEIE